MNKLMNKKVNMFGKEVSVFALVMVAMATLVTAALVPYLSNTVSGNVDVSSPVTLAVATDVPATEVWGTAGGLVPVVFTGDSIATISAIGGDSKNVWVYADNGAGIPVDKNVVFTIENTEGLTEAEVDGIVTFDIYDWDNSVDPRVKINSVNGLVVPAVCDGNICTITVPTYLFEDGLGDNFYANVHFNFPLNAHGTYDMSAEIIN